MGSFVISAGLHAHKSLWCAPHAVQAGLALAAAIDNWQAFLAAGAGSGGGPGRGWSAGLPLCQWSGVTCTDQQQVQSM